MFETIASTSIVVLIATIIIGGYSYMVWLERREFKTRMHRYDQAMEKFWMKVDAGKLDDSEMRLAMFKSINTRYPIRQRHWG